MERRFYPENDEKWRFRFLFVYTLPFFVVALGLCVYQLQPGVVVDIMRKLHSFGEDEGTKGELMVVSIPMSLFVVAGVVLDGSALAHMARNIVFATNEAVPVIDVDSRPSRGVMSIAGPTTYGDGKRSAPCESRPSTLLFLIEPFPAPKKTLAPRP